MGRQQVIHIEGTSGIAIAGLVFSVLGWFTCGVLCVPGFFLSAVAMFERGPKGTATAGLLIGSPGLFLFVFFGLVMLWPAINASIKADNTRNTPVANAPPPDPIDTAAKDAAKARATANAKARAAADEKARLEKERLARDEELARQRNEAFRLWMADNPEPDPPEFESIAWYSQGLSHKMTGAFVSADSESVTLAKEDGSKIVVKRDELSAGSNGKVDDAIKKVEEHESLLEQWQDRADAEKLRIESELNLQA